MKTEVSTMRTGTVSGTSMSEQKTSADVIASSDDLLTEILRRLPIKSLLQFKSVSQHWCSLISSPDFSRLRFPNPKSAEGLYLYHSSEQGCLINFLPLVYESAGMVPFRPITFKDPQTPRCFQSCNGLLCVCLVKNSCCGFVMSNTTTWQSTRFVKLGGGFHGFSLAFDPFKSPHYKVVCVRSYYAPLRLFQIEIYSSETGFWRASGDPFAAYDNFLFDGGVFWNGAIHWVSTGGTSLCFDVDEEKFRAMPPMPPIPNGWDRRSISYFGESEGHLHLVQIYHLNEQLDEFTTLTSSVCLTGRLHVFEMERDCSGWFDKYQVNFDMFAEEFPKMICFGHLVFDILCIIEGETDEEYAYLVLHIPGGAIRYNLKDKTYKKLCNFGVPLEVGKLKAWQFIKSLARV